ncbi:hypothetical protein GCM10022384_61320 [Streptomyces marokkonensis]|uniref:Uncharacterized protein n=1 Tax=Streptomyces marokkonensis TaxID=324855 RepID=A0ABP7S5E2_9ACTN
MRGVAGRGPLTASDSPRPKPIVDAAARLAGTAGHVASAGPGPGHAGFPGVRPSTGVAEGPSVIPIADVDTGRYVNGKSHRSA